MRCQSQRQEGGRVMTSRPSIMLRHKVSGSAAPGKAPLMPMMAKPSVSALPVGAAMGWAETSVGKIAAALGID